MYTDYMDMQICSESLENVTSVGIQDVSALCFTAYPHISVSVYKCCFPLAEERNKRETYFSHELGAGSQYAGGNGHEV